MEVSTIELISGFVELDDERSAHSLKHMLPFHNVLFETGQKVEPKR